MSPPESLNIVQILKQKNIRVTRQRTTIAAHLLQNEYRHVTAEQLSTELKLSGHNIALATIYNTLNLFATQGLLKVVTLTPTLNIYDTNTTQHQHIYNETTKELIDAPMNILVGHIKTDCLPEKTTLSGVDIIVRVNQSD